MLSFSFSLFSLEEASPFVPRSAPKVLVGRDAAVPSGQLSAFCPLLTALGDPDEVRFLCVPSERSRPHCLKEQKNPLPR